MSFHIGFLLRLQKSTWAHLKKKIKSAKKESANIDQMRGIKVGAEIKWVSTSWDAVLDQFSWL